MMHNRLKIFIFLLPVFLYHNIRAGEPAEQKHPGSLADETSVYTPFARYESKSGILRYIYTRVQGSENISPVKTAEKFLKQYARFLGVEKIDESLSLRGVQASPAGTHFSYTQKIANIPVYNSELIITVDNDNEVVFVANNIRPGIKVNVLNPVISQHRSYLGQLNV